MKGYTPHTRKHVGFNIVEFNMRDRDKVDTSTLFTLYYTSSCHKKHGHPGGGKKTV